jgi:Na+/H+-dicarboxylate symporter
MSLNNTLTVRILVFMFAGVVLGLLLRFLSSLGIDSTYSIGKVLVIGGDVFLSLVQMPVVPIVFVAIVCGICSFEKAHAISRMGLRSLFWFVITTASAIFLAVIAANIFNVGSDLHLEAINKITLSYTPSLWQFVHDVVPSNPIKAMVDSNMLQVIAFSVLFGIGINISGEHGRKIASFFYDLNVVGTKYIALLMHLAPYGIFCLMATLLASQGFELIMEMLEYFVAVLLALFLHAAITFSSILYFSKLSPRVFFHKVYSTMLFAFGLSSSNTSIPIMLDTVEHKLGVSKRVASFVVPFGININKNGTAIMQSIATLFIANAYHVNISLVGYAILFFMVVFISLGTVGAPSIGLVTLIVVLKQLGLPIEGMALVIGVDRLLDMVRTSVNVTGNALVACLVGQAEKQLNYEVYYKTESPLI